MSMPCWELFEQQPQSYRDTVLPPSVRARVSIEAAAPFGWERYVGLEGAIIGVTEFGASAPGPVVMREFGFTPEHVVETTAKTSLLETQPESAPCAPAPSERGPASSAQPLRLTLLSRPLSRTQRALVCVGPSRRHRYQAFGYSLD